MKRKLAAVAFGLLTTTAIALGALGPAGTANAHPETDSAQIDFALFTSDHARLPTWLRHSIIVCAAETIEARVSTVKAGLRAGYSLKQIAARYHVRPIELSRGILSCEREFLWRLVENEKLDRAQFYRLMYFLTTHIERIINYHYHPTDAVLRDVVTDLPITDAATTDVPVRDAVTD